MVQAEIVAPPPRRRRWRRWLVVLMVLTAVAVFHRPLLWLAALALVVDEPADHADVVVLLGTQRDYNLPANYFRSGAHILLVLPQPTRLDRLGVVPNKEEITRRELTARQVPDSALSVVRAEQANEWGDARSIRDWLAEHPDNHVVVLVDRFQSRRMRWTLNSVLGRDADRAHVKSKDHPWYDETNWWRRKEGIISAMRGYTGLAWLLIVGDSPDFGEASLDKIPRRPE